jgi:hypothetical protein
VCIDEEFDDTEPQIGNFEELDDVLFDMSVRVNSRE